MSKPQRKKNSWTEFMKEEFKKAKSEGRKTSIAEISTKYKAEGRKKTKSACSGKTKDNCLPPCKWSQGTKRSYCHAVGIRKKTTKPRPQRKLTINDKILPSALNDCNYTSQTTCSNIHNCSWKSNKCVNTYGI